MPDVLARDVADADKDFVVSYARQHGLSQAEVVRRVFHAGVNQLRASDATDDADWDRLADSLAALGEADFEATAWQ